MDKYFTILTAVSPPRFVRVLEQQKKEENIWRNEANDMRCFIQTDFMWRQQHHLVCIGGCEWCLVAHNN